MCITCPTPIHKTKAAEASLLMYERMCSLTRMCSHKTKAAEASLLMDVYKAYEEEDTCIRQLMYVYKAYEEEDTCIRQLMYVYKAYEEEDTCIRQLMYVYKAYDTGSKGTTFENAYLSAGSLYSIIEHE